MADLKARYKRNENFVFRRIENETVLLPVKDDVEDMDAKYSLNELGAFVWDHLDGRNRLLDIKNMILEEFEVAAASIEGDLSAFIDQLKKVEAIEGVTY